MEIYKEMVNEQMVGLDAVVLAGCSRMIGFRLLKICIQMLICGVREIHHRLPNRVDAMPLTKLTKGTTRTCGWSQTFPAAMQITKCYDTITIVLPVQTSTLNYQLLLAIHSTNLGSV